ncbi:MAG TPA: hypothetical protein VL354_00280 [Spirochaetia bacterium]|nr:hypothetical protein [Spirochaetia bacterium]
MNIKDSDIFKIVERIGDHYQNNISNRFIRKALVLIDLPQSEWDRLDSLTTKSEYYKNNGFQFEELYEMVIAAAHFIFQARTKMLPNLKSIIAQGSSDTDKVLREMAAQNFPLNLGILSDQINELYMKTTGLDRDAHEKTRPVYERIPELKDLGRFLVNA